MPDRLWRVTARIGGVDVVYDDVPADDAQEACVAVLGTMRIAARRDCDRIWAVRTWVVSQDG